MEETAKQSYIPLRPVTPPHYGFRSNVDEAADQNFAAWKMLLEECPISEIAEATGLTQQFVAALADRFW